LKLGELQFPLFWTSSVPVSPLKIVPELPIETTVHN
jgi:hypothetical protein